MALESATYINGLVSTNPLASDPRADGDDHIRLIKAALQATFPNINGAVNPTPAELNYLTGVTSGIQAQFSALSTSLATKAPSSSPAFSGTSTFTGDLKMSGKPILFAGINVTANATACDIWDSNYVNLTGSAVNFTDFPDAPQAGCEVELFCNHTHTFTHSANLNVDGGTQTAAVGDRVRVRALSTTVFKATIIRATPFSTGPERISGIDASRAVTPAALAYGNYASQTGNIWHAGGILEMWGTLGVNTDIPAGGLEVTCWFPDPFPNECFQCLAIAYNYGASNVNVFLVEHGIATSYAKFYAFEGSAGVQSTWGIRWRAIGK